MGPAALHFLCLLLQITQQVDEQTEGPPLTLTAVSGQSISLTTDMLKVRAPHEPYSNSSSSNLIYVCL